MAPVKARDHAPARDHGRAGAAQSQGRHAPVIEPQAPAAGGLKREDLAVDGADDDHAVRLSGRREDFTGDPRAPELLAGLNRAGDDLALAGADADQGLIGARPARYGQLGVFFPHGLAAGRIQRGDIAPGIGREQITIQQGRFQLDE